MAPKRKFRAHRRGLERISNCSVVHETRRKIICERMALPKDKRQTEEQVVAFAKKATQETSSITVGSIRIGNLGAILLRRSRDGCCRALARY
jgi:hypothetical protein